MRVRPEVNGSLFHEGEFVELDHDAEWADRHPLVVANPDAFESTDAHPIASRSPKPRTKKET